MIDFKTLKQPRTTNEKELLSQLENLANECSLFESPTTRHDYDMGVTKWINNFTGELAFKKQKYLSHYLKKKYEYIENKKK